MFLITFDESYYMFLEPKITDEPHLPIEVDAPCDLNNNFWFVVSYFVEVNLIYLYGILMTAMDCIFCKWCMMISCFFEILYENFKNIDYENDKRALEHLKANVARHIKVLR